MIYFLSGTVEGDKEIATVIITYTFFVLITAWVVIKGSEFFKRKENRKVK